MIRAPQSGRALRPGVLEREVEMRDADFVKPREIVLMGQRAAAACQSAAAETRGRCSRSAGALADDVFADRRSAHNLTRS
jgi:hypothetical protein